MYCSYCNTYSPLGIWCLRVLRDRPAHCTLCPCASVSSLRTAPIATRIPRSVSGACACSATICFTVPCCLALQSSAYVLLRQLHVFPARYLGACACSATICFTVPCCLALQSSAYVLLRQLHVFPARYPNHLVQCTLRPCVPDSR